MVVTEIHTNKNLQEMINKLKVENEASRERTRQMRIEAIEEAEKEIQENIEFFGKGDIADGINDDLKKHIELLKGKL